jgi:hypothetical protein
MEMKKSNLLLLAFILFGSCECEQEPLTKVLGNPCYIDREGEIVEVQQNSEEYKEKNTGICSTGKININSDKDLICVGEVGPREEDCNNLDDNCNGYVDDDFSGYELINPFYSSQNTCNRLGVCRYADQKCINGEWFCEYPDNFGKEVCDGRDNDCDGETDEDTYDEPIFDAADRYVYTADLDTLNIGECRAGYKECVDGIVSVRNMRTPIPEICGNDDDDDCDGITDEVETDRTESEFALVIDYSGSMSDVIESVADALCSWSVQGVLQNSRFAVIGIGYTGPGNNRQTKVLTDFTDSATACTAIRIANRPEFAGGMEQQLNATFNANDPTASSGYVNWSSGTRRVLIFSDEQLQQDFRPTVEEAIEVVVEQCTQIGYTIGVFINYNVVDQALWVDLSQRCNGFLDYLNYNPQQMIDQLNYWVGTDC